MENATYVKDMQKHPTSSCCLHIASEFNGKVAMDLKQWKERWILHIIDMWSRYTISVIINRKGPSDVGNALMQRWIGVFDIMGSTMTDHGGEFSSDEMREIMSILNVKVITTVAKSPFQGYKSGYTRSYAGQIWQEISCRCGMGTVAIS